MTMMHINLEDSVVQALRRKAQHAGKAPEDLLAEAAARLAAAPDDAPAAESGKDWILEFVEMARKSGGDSKGWKWNRDEIHER